MMFLAKAIKILRSGNPLRGVIRALNKSPLRYVNKFVATLRHPVARSMRVAAARRMEVSPTSVLACREIERKGYAVVSASMDASLLTELHQYAHAQLNRANSFSRDTGRKKDFWVYLSDKELAEHRLTTDHIYVRFSLQEPILKTVAEYFGEAPYLTYVLLTYSRHTDAPLKISQLWHCDRDDTKILKLFTYLSDVEDARCGPFTLFDRQSSKRVRGSFFMEHMEDQRVFARVHPGDVVQMTGRRFTTFLVDTGACFHMGSRVAAGHSRLMFTAVYTSYPSIYPGAPKNQIGVVGPVSALQHMALRV